MPALKLFKSISAIRRFVATTKAANPNAVIGFLPTLGALHDGHSSLIKQAVKQCDCVIVSVFLNRHQFRPKGFVEYRRDLKSDLVVASSAGADAVFAPPESEMYPSGKVVSLALPEIFKKLSNQRLGWHFNAVLVVVAKLFNIVTPHKVYFGQKDPHQLVLIEAMVQSMNMDIEVIGCKTVRHRNGLAISSRNKQLNAAGLSAATVIYRALKPLADGLRAGKQPAKLMKQAEAVIAAEPLAELQLLELLDSESLKPFGKCSKGGFCFATVLICGKRLTDNIRFTMPKRGR